MTLEEFKNDDRYGVIDETEIACHGGTGSRVKQVCMAAAWLLDPENSVGFGAVLDPGDMTVATLGYGHVVWTPLADFEA